MRVTLDLHKLVILLLCVVFASCDSPFQTGTSSQLLTTSELEDRARDRGINPDFVDFQQMRKSGEHDIFISHPITLSGDQIRSLQKKWPSKARSVPAGVSSDRTTSKASYYTGPLFPPDQDDCWSINGGDWYTSDFCYCVRNPDECWSNEDDEPFGGGSAPPSDEDPPDDNDDSSDGGGNTGDGCPGYQAIYEDPNVDTHLDAGTYFHSNSGLTTDGRVAFTSTSYSQVVLTGVDGWCYDGDASVSADLTRVASNGSRILLNSQSDGSPVLYEDYASVTFHGDLPQTGTSSLEQTATHELAVDVAGYAFDQRSETTMDILAW